MKKMTCSLLIVALCGAVAQAEPIVDFMSSQVEIWGDAQGEVVAVFDVQMRIDAVGETIFVNDTDTFGGCGFWRNGTRSEMIFAKAFAYNVSSGATESANGWIELQEGESMTLMLSAVPFLQQNGIYSFQMDWLEWSQTDAGPREYLELEDFRTPNVALTPEPTTVLLLGLTASLALFRRRK